MTLSYATLTAASELSATADIETLLSRGASAARQRRGRKADDAIPYLTAALLHTVAHEDVYLRVTRTLQQVFESEGLSREALTLAWYRTETPDGFESDESLPRIDRARTHALGATLNPGRALEGHLAAARELEQASLLVRAAIHYEAANEARSAAALWSRLADMLDSRPNERYAAGLARFNLARQNRALGNAKLAHEATVAAVHRLEQAADHFESIGQRERAFDCFHVLLAIGESSSTFEHALEGSANCIRILSEDHLKHHALRFYERAIELAERAGEHAAAATLAREMTLYARKQGQARLAERGTNLQARLWERAGESTLERGGPPELAENAFVASLIADAEVGQYELVGAAYRRLMQMDLEPARREHYARAAERYRDAKNRTSDLPESASSTADELEHPDVWHVDLLEWEEQGSAAEACADILLDPGEIGDPITRRSALVGRLAALAADGAPVAEREQANLVLCEYLAPIRLYALLSPLERLFRDRSPSVRSAAISAISRYFYKRTFVTLEQSLRDPAPEVAAASAEALQRLRFVHAFDPLARIYRSNTRSSVRIAALRAIAQIDVDEAADLLLGVLDHGTDDERNEAIRALKDNRASRFIDAARAAYADASPRLKKALADVFRSRGVVV